MPLRPSVNAALLAMDSQPIPAQLSPPALNLWTVSSLTDNHWTTPILYTSSTNYTKALTEATGEAVLTANPNNKPPSQPLHPDPHPLHPQMLDAQRLSCRTCKQPLTSNLSCVGRQFFFVLCGRIVKNLMCLLLVFYGSMSAHSRPLMFSASDMYGWNVNS